MRTDDERETLVLELGEADVAELDPTTFADRPPDEARKELRKFLHQKWKRGLGALDAHEKKPHDPPIVWEIRTAEPTLRSLPWELVIDRPTTADSKCTAMVVYTGAEAPPLSTLIVSVGPSDGTESALARRINQSQRSDAIHLRPRAEEWVSEALDGIRRNPSVRVLHLICRVVAGATAAAPEFEGPVEGKTWTSDMLERLEPHASGLDLVYVELAGAPDRMQSKAIGDTIYDALRRAGARHVILCYPPGGEHPSPFTGRFYDELAKGQSVREAYEEARRRTLADPPEKCGSARLYTARQRVTRELQLREWPFRYVGWIVTALVLSCSLLAAFLSATLWGAPSTDQPGKKNAALSVEALPPPPSGCRAGPSLVESKDSRAPGTERAHLLEWACDFDLRRSSRDVDGARRSIRAMHRVITRWRDKQPSDLPEDERADRAALARAVDALTVCQSGQNAFERALCLELLTATFSGGLAHEIAGEALATRRASADIRYLVATARHTSKYEGQPSLAEVDPTQYIDELEAIRLREPSHLATLYELADAHAGIAGREAKAARLRTQADTLARQRRDQTH